MKLKLTEEQFVRSGKGSWEREKAYRYLAARHEATPVTYGEMTQFTFYDPDNPLRIISIPTIKKWFKALGVDEHNAKFKS